MSDPVIPDPSSDVVQSVSTALRASPLMSRVHDPDRVLSDDMARHLIGSLGRVGIVISAVGGRGADDA